MERWRLGCGAPDRGEARCSVIYAKLRSSRSDIYLLVVVI